MTTVTLLTKECSKCHEIKPLSEFHRNKGTPDGHRYDCAPCVNESVKANTARRRAEMGEEAFKSHVTAVTRRHREKTGNQRGKAYAAARNAAIAALVEAHRPEFEQRLQLAKYEAGLA